MLVVNNVGPPTLLRNDLPAGRGRVTIRLSQGGPNPEALGAQVWIQADPDGPSVRHDIHRNMAFLSQVPPRVRIGLGDDRDALHEVRVVWPDGSEQVLADVGPGAHVVTR